MKRFELIVTPEAQSGIRESFLYIHERSPLNVARWLVRLGNWRKRAPNQKETPALELPRQPRNTAQRRGHPHRAQNGLRNGLGRRHTQRIQGSPRRAE